MKTFSDRTTRPPAAAAAVKRQGTVRPLDRYGAVTSVNEDIEGRGLGSGPPRPGKSRQQPASLRPASVLVKQFPCTAHRWWSTLADDSEDTTNESLAVLRIARLRRFLRRWQKRQRLRRLYRLKRARNKLILHSHRKPLSHYTGFCLRFWLRRWRRGRLWQVRLRNDRSWKNILERTRSWKRYLFTRPFFILWVTHTRDYCAKRNASLQRQNQIATQYTAIGLRRALAFWRVSAHAVRCIKRACFHRILQYMRAERVEKGIPILVKTWARFLQREALKRWRRRSRWPKAIELNRKTAVKRGLTRWARAATTSSSCRGLIIRATLSTIRHAAITWRQNLEGWIVHRDALSIAVAFYRRVKLHSFALEWNQLATLRARLHLLEDKWAWSFCRTRALTGALGVLQTLICIGRARRQRWTESVLEHSIRLPGYSRVAEERRKRSVGQCADSQASLLAWETHRKRRLHSALQEWVRRYRRHVRLIASAQLSALAGREARTCLWRWRRYCRSRDASRRLALEATRSHADKTLRNGFARLLIASRNRGRATLQLRQGREHCAGRALPWAFGRWNRISLRAKQLRRLVWFLRCSRVLRRIRERTTALLGRAIVVKRADLRFGVSAIRRAIWQWVLVKRRRRTLQRLFRVFRALHPVPRCGPAMVVLQLWSAAARQKRRVRIAHWLCLKARRGGLMLAAWRHWGEVLFKSRVLRPFKLSIALRKWDLWKRARAKEYDLFQRFVALRGFRKQVLPLPTGADGRPLLPAELPRPPVVPWMRQRHNGLLHRSAAVRAVVRFAVQSESFSRFRALCRLRRVFALWELASALYKGEARARSAAALFCSRRAAALAAARPLIVPLVARCRLARLWACWRESFGARMKLSKRVAAVAVLRPVLLFWWRVYESRLRGRLAAAVPAAKTAAGLYRRHTPNTQAAATAARVGKYGGSGEEKG